MKFPLIDRVEAGHVLTRAEAEAAMEELLSGRVETPEIVRLLAALNRRPIEVQELAGIARPARAAARQTCWKRWGCGSICRSNSMGGRSGRLASDFCLRKPHTRPHGTRLPRVNRSACEPCSIFWGRSRIQRARNR